MLTEEIDGGPASSCAREDGFDAAVSARDRAGAIARIALSHYMFPDTDRAAVRRQIRAAAGLAAR